MGLVPKQDSKKLAHIRMLMVSIFSKRSKLENLYLQIWAYLRRRRRCTALELVVDQSGSLDVSSRVLSRFFDLVGHQTTNASIIELLNNKLHGLLPPGGLVSPPVLLPKFSPDRTIILAKEQFHN